MLSLSTKDIYVFFFFLEKIKRPPLKDIIKIKQVLGACELGLDGSRAWAGWLTRLGYFF
jgi:hypothetical protein